VSERRAADLTPADLTPARGRSSGAALLGALLVSLLAPPGGAEIGRLDAAQAERLRSGQVVVVPADEERAVCAAVWVRAAPEDVWSVMVDCPRAPEFVPGMRGCKVLEEHGDVSLIEHRVKVIDLLPEMTYVFRVEHDPYRRIRFRRVSGALREMTGEWRLRADRGGTLVTYEVELDPGFPIPRWAVRRALGRDVPALLTALKLRVEEDAGRREEEGGDGG
jgi:ribosome-associated toxin RatA of RatAB toxin-antitoxin module